MTTLTLNTKRGSFDINETDILVDKFIRPFSCNPRNVRLWIIGHEFGAFVALWASNEQDAFDDMIDAGYKQFLVDDPEPDYEEYAYLGNASEPCDLTYAWIEPVIFDYNNKNDFDIMAKFIIAEERGLDNLDFYI